MSQTTIPKEAELRNWAARELSAKGSVGLEKMPRLESVTLGAQSGANASLACRRDEQHRYLVDISTDMTVVMQCQRCLKPCDVELSAAATLCVLWDDDAASELPARYDPLISGDVTNLHALVEDELLLALPAVPMHRREECQHGGNEFGNGADAEVPQRENPFAALGDLLKGDPEDSAEKD
ncbi:MAG: hypothetical protein DWQ28_12105 [Proteobacteria bacterium]|nr:MAG: hypothetical protein DWQ28_12105 [Pseudomonadota bacterium]